MTPGSNSKALSLRNSFFAGIAVFILCVLQQRNGVTFFLPLHEYRLYVVHLLFHLLVCQKSVPMTFKVMVVKPFSCNKKPDDNMYLIT
jgi:hypothetical protein